MELTKTKFKQTELGLIPEDWEVEKLDNILKFGSGQDYKHLSKGDVPVYGTGGIMTFVNDYLFNGHSVGIGRKGTIDKPVLLSGKFWTVDTLFYTHSFIRTIPKFVYYKFLTIQWRDYNEASGVPSLNKNTLGKIQIPLPPLPEQKAIAQVLSDTDNLIQALEKKLAKKRAIKQGAMQQLLTPKEDWEVKKLGELAKYRRGSFPQPYGLPQWYDDNNGTPFVQVYDVDKNMRLKSTTKQKISDLAKDKSVFVEKGNIILTIQGSIGRIALTQYDAYVDRTLLIFTDYKVPIDKVFFSYVIQEKFRIEKENAPGGIIKTITKEALSKFDIPLPKTLEEQFKIGLVLSDMDAEITQLEQKLNKYKLLKQGLIQELLTGKIRLI